MAYVERMRVAYADVDVMNHVNNAAYFTYMETARCHYYMGIQGIPEPRQLDIIVASQRCDYHRGLQYDEVFDVIVWPGRIGTTSFTLNYVLRTDKGEIVAEAETVIVAYDYARGVKKPIDPTVRKRLEDDHRRGPGVSLPAPRKP